MGRSKHRHNSNGHANGNANGHGQQVGGSSSNVAPVSDYHPQNSANGAQTAAIPVEEPATTDNLHTNVVLDPHAVGEQIEFLTSELDDRDQLVAALTAQLEEAVEQLDRLHRQGADRSARSGGGSSASVPGDFIDEQRASAERLNQWLDQWDQSQPLDLWARIEDRINDLAAHLGAQGAAHAVASVSHAAAFAAPAIQRETPAEQAPPASSWEETKQRLLGEMSFNFGDPTPAAPDAAADSSATAVAPHGPQISLSDVQFPAAIDLDGASREDLCAAVETRDKYISYLTHRLRASEFQQPIDWDALNQAPAEMRQQLVDLERRYQEHLRREECDLALERARLAREQARLQQDRVRLEHQMRRAGIAADDLRPAGGPSEADDRSWLKMFGKKR
jgi:hypothetical protein